MKNIFILVSFLVCLYLCGHSLAAKPKVVCYWASWSKQKVQDIDPTLCTHLHYAFFVVDIENNTIADSEGQPKPDVYKSLVNLKKKNPDLKVIPSVGGWGHSNSEFSHIVNNAELRKKFIENTVGVLRKYQFDGLDLDWEYPVCWEGKCSAGPVTDRENFGKFIMELRETFDSLNSLPRLSLSAAVMADQPGGHTSDTSYDYKALAKAMDYINVMTYAFADAGSKVTLHNAPYNHSILNIQYYVKKGVPKDKVVLGVGFYGHSYKLADKTKHGEGAPVLGVGQTNPNYRDICNSIKQKGWNKDHGDGQHDPIAYHDDQWIGYDDPFSVNDKSVWVKDNGFGGIIIWEISMDDYNKECCSVTNPLLRAINHGLYGTGDEPEKYGCEQK